MLGFEFLFLGFLALILLFVSTKSRHPKYNLPPGPPNLPFIGSLLHILAAGDRQRPAVGFQKMARKYGDIFSIKAGSVQMVVLNSDKLLREIASLDDFNDRTDGEAILYQAKSNSLPLGLIFGCQKYWADTSTLCHKLLRKYGFKSKSTIENILISELEEFCAAWKKEIQINGEVVCIQNQFYPIYFNVIWTILTGKRCCVSDPQQQRLIHVTAEYVRGGIVGGGIGGMYPSLLEKFPRLTGFAKLQEVCQEWQDTLKGVLQEHRKDGAYKSQQNFIDEVLCLIDEQENKGNPMDSIYTDENLIAILQDMLIGSIDSMAHLFKFLIHTFLLHPDVQRRAQEEVERIVGRNRRVTVDDIPSLIYTQALLQELFRTGSQAPMTPRQSLENSNIMGYDIPKGTVVLLNLWAVNYEEGIWKDATRFDPQRFIDPVTGELVNVEKLWTFGVGKRKCIGEQLGRTNMIITLVTFLQEFTFQIDPKSGLPPNDYDRHRFNRDHIPFNVLVKIREE